MRLLLPLSICPTVLLGSWPLLCQVSIYPHLIYWVSFILLCLFVLLIERIHLKQYCSADRIQGSVSVIVNYALLLILHAYESNCKCVLSCSAAALLQFSKSCLEICCSQDPQQGTGSLSSPRFSRHYAELFRSCTCNKTIPHKSVLWFFTNSLVDNELMIWQHLVYTSCTVLTCHLCPPGGHEASIGRHCL